MPSVTAMAQVPDLVDEFSPSSIMDRDLREMVADRFLGEKEVVQWKPGHPDGFPMPNAEEIIVFGLFFH